MKMSPTLKPVSVSALVLPSQVGDASVPWYSALRDCWANVSLLPLQEEVLFGSKLSPAQQELAHGAAGSNSQEHMPQGSEPSQSMENHWYGQGDPPPVPFDPEDTLPSLHDLCVLVSKRMEIVSWTLGTLFLSIAFAVVESEPAQVTSDLFWWTLIRCTMKQAGSLCRH